MFAAEDLCPAGQTGRGEAWKRKGEGKNKWAPEGPRLVERGQGCQGRRGPAHPVPHGQGHGRRSPPEQAGPEGQLRGWTDGPNVKIVLLCLCSLARRWQRAFSGSCRRMANTSRKAQCARAAGNPCSSSRKEKNLVPEPSCGHAKTGPATLPPTAPAIRADRGVPMQWRQSLVPHLWREAQFEAQSSSHPPADPRDRVGTKTRKYVELWNIG